MKRIVVLALLAALLFLTPVVSATIYHMTLMLDKPAYGPDERIELYGTLLAGATPLNNTIVTITVDSSTYTLTTSSDGAFYSRSDYYPSATLVSAPNTTRNYTVSATYLTANTSVLIYVIPVSVNNIILNMNKGSYYAGENIRIVVKTRSKKRPVANASINGSIRDSNDTIVSNSNFSCVTNPGGICTLTLTAPSTSGKYTIQTDDYLGYSVFWVNPFDVSVLMKDSSATTDRYSYKRGDEGYVNVVVTYNSTTPAGTYTATGIMQDENGTTVYTLDSASLTQNNSYSTNMPFTLNTNFTTGNYRAIINVSKTGGETVSKSSAYFEVRDWTLTVEKTTTASGFEHGYTAFPNTTVFLEAIPIDKSTSSTITGLAGNFTINLKSNFGAEVTNATAVYNSGCDCYKFNLTMPSTTGSYVLSVSVYYNETQTVEKIITVDDITASAITTDAAGNSRDAFTSEYIYIKPVLSNSTNSSLDPTDAEVVAVIYENGSRYTYTNVSNWSAVDMTNNILEWSWNGTSKMIKMDAPNIGGLYKAEIYVNNRNASAVAKFLKKLYIMRASFKNSDDVSVTNDYWWHFKTSDTLYAHLAVIEADVNILQNLTGTDVGNGSDMWGMGSAPLLSSSTENAVVNASITMKVYHAETGKEELLNTTNSVCKTTSTDGKYICTLQPNSSIWTGGGHRVEFSVTSADGKTKDTGGGWFEARAFYIYGWADNWMNKPSANITLNIDVYVPGSDWWSSRSGGGIDGTATLEKIEYMGTGEYWLRSPVTYDFNITNLNSTTVSDGQGTMDLNASRAPGNTWKSGSYMAVIKVTETSSGTTDYGRIWFEIRNWDVYAQPVDVVGNNIQYRWQFNNYENVSLYVVINNAGEWGTSGSSLGGNVTISVKSIKNYITWPPKDMNSSAYESTNITVNASNTYFWGSAISTSAYDKYVMNLSPTSRNWDSGYYTVILDVNGTETGYAWFSAIAFYVNTRSVNENFTDAYTVKGTEPLYFNITTTKNQRWGSYATNDYVNTTIKEITLRRYSRDTYEQIEYKYPGDINVSVVGVSNLEINGTGTLNISLADGSNWSSGYYNGEMILEDVNGSDGNGWLWVDVRPFRVHFGTANSWSYPTIGLNDNVTGTLSIYEPTWNSWTVLTGNYTIDNITQENWNMYGMQIIHIANYTPPANENFSGSTSIVVQPNTGGWTGSYTYKTIKPTISDASDSSETGYINFRALPALVSITRNSSYDISTSSNITVNITITEPGNTSAGSTLNLTSITEWVWDPSSSRSTLNNYNFTVGSCSSRTADSGGCLINSTPASDNNAAAVTVTVEVPDDGWSEGYHYPNMIFSRTDQQTNYNHWEICNWDSGCSMYFRAKEPITAYMYAHDWRNGETDNVTMYIYYLRDVSGNSVTVNVTQVQYAKQVGNCWSDSCRVYATAEYNVTNWAGVSTGSDEIISAGYITLITPAGNWERGEYYTKVTVESGSDTARIKSGSFRIVDTTPPNISTTSPTNGQTINASAASSFLVSGTTTKNARCMADIRNYDTYYSWYCGASGNSTNTSLVIVCNNTLYNGSAYFYDYITAWCYSGAKCMYTGAMSHSYTYTITGMTDQDYVIQWWCYDDDWNGAENQTVFTMVGTSGITVSNVTLLSPSNASTSGSANVNFTWQVASNANNYTFHLANSTTFSSDVTVNNTNISSINVIMFNLANGTTYYWRVIGYNGSSTGNWSDVWQVEIDTSNNTAPTVQSVILNTSGDTNYTTQDLLCWATPSDNDSGNIFKAYVRWWNGTQNQDHLFMSRASISNGTQTLVSTLDSFKTIGGQTWNCSVIFDDGAANSSSWVNATLAVQNQSPQWSNTGTNTTLAGNDTLFYTYWTGNSGLSGYIFGFDNGSSLQNDSWTAFTGTGNWSNVTKGINSTVSIVISWIVYVNDSGNAWNNTGVQTFNTTS